MVQQLILVRVGDADILVEAAQVAGPEPTTARIQDPAQYMSGVFSRAQDTILEVPRSTAQVIEKAGKEAVKPDRVEAEFGLRSSATGNVIVAGATAESILKVAPAFGGKSRASKNS